MRNFIYIIITISLLFIISLNTFADSTQSTYADFDTVSPNIYKDMFGLETLYFKKQGVGSIIKGTDTVAYRDGSYTYNFTAGLNMTASYSLAVSPLMLGYLTCDYEVNQVAGSGLEWTYYSSQVSMSANSFMEYLNATYVKSTSTICDCLVYISFDIQTKTIENVRPDEHSLYVLYRTYLNSFKHYEFALTQGSFPVSNTYVSIGAQQFASLSGNLTDIRTAIASGYYEMMFTDNSVSHNDNFDVVNTLYNLKMTFSFYPRTTPSSFNITFNWFTLAMSSNTGQYPYHKDAYFMPFYNESIATPFNFQSVVTAAESFFDLNVGGITLGEIGVLLIGLALIVVILRFKI